MIELKQYPANKPKRLRNVRCAYCACEFGEIEPTKEHVIGRKFVPLGKLENQWNLILNACEPCNAKKSELEDDISVITMHPDLSPQANHDPVLLAEVTRKADNSFSRRTRKPVSDSHETQNISTSPMPGVNFNFGLTAPPQLDEQRAMNLAMMQVTGFFYMLTYNEESNHGGYWPGAFAGLNMARKPDWGNSVQTDFAKTTMHWHPRMALSTANGYFKCLIKKKEDADCWSWAMEWNSTTRLIGFCGDTEGIRSITEKMPWPKLTSLQSPEGVELKYRVEIPLNPEDDTLFYYDD